MAIFEKIIITCPSVLLMGVLILQLYAVAIYMDSSFDIREKGKTWVERMIGFYVLAPTHLFYFFLWYYLLAINVRRSTTIQNDELQLMSGGDGGGGTNELSAILASTSNEDGGVMNVSEEQLRNTPMTAEEHNMEVAINASIGNQAMMLWPGVWAVSFKISYDTRSEVPWAIVVLPWAFVLFGYMCIGITKQNWVWRDHRFGHAD